MCVDMKRDLNLLRAILLRIEEIDSLTIHSDVLLDLCGDPNNLAFHIHLLVESGYLAIHDHVSYIGGERFLISHITSSGCDYLDSVRNESIWNTTLQKIKDFGGTVSLDIVKDIGTALIRGQLGV